MLSKMKFFYICIIACITIGCCDICHLPSKEHTIYEEIHDNYFDYSIDEWVITIPKEMYAKPFDYTMKWEDYNTDFKPYNVLDMTHKSVSEINRLYGEPIFNETDTICYGKRRHISVDTIYYYHEEPDIAFKFRKTPNISLHEMRWKMNRDNITYILVLYCIDKDGDRYPVYGYAYDEKHPHPK